MALFVCLFIHLFREKELVKVLAKTKKPKYPCLVRVQSGYYYSILFLEHAKVVTDCLQDTMMALLSVPSGC